MKYTYAIAPFNEKTGQIGDVITWKEGTLEEAQNVVHKDNSVCVFCSITRMLHLMVFLLTLRLLKTSFLKNLKNWV